jgi:polyphosphate kinase 2 (PPK2 family)
MLEKIDLSKKFDKRAFKQIMPELSNRLYIVQKASWDANIPVIILFEGWDAAGKGTSIQKLTSPLDPRGFKLYPIRAARTYEKKHPWLWRFWQKILLEASGQSLTVPGTAGCWWSASNSSHPKWNGAGLTGIS